MHTARGNEILGKQITFAYSVSMRSDGRTVAVGDPHGGDEFSVGVFNQGRLRVFDYEVPR